MKSRQYDERLALLTPIVRENFDIATVARIALGRNWRRIREDQQNTVASLMEEVIVSSYASRFPEYSGQYFEVTGETPIKSNRMIVRSRLHTRDETVDLDYQLVLKEGEWKIFDVVANGVSDLSLKRSTYADTFKDDGIEGVIREIRQTIDKNRKKAVVSN